MKKLNLNEAGILSILEPLQKRLFLWQTIGVVSVLLGVVLASVFGTTIMLVGYIISIGVGIFAGYQYNIAKKHYTNTYKKLLAEKVLEACFEEAHYSPEQGFTREEFSMAGVFSLKGHNFSYHSEDLITGRQSGVEFKQSDVKVTHRTGGKNRSTIVDVNGRLTRFQYNKDILGRILITSKNFSPAVSSLELHMFGSAPDISQILQNSMGTSLKTITMEDVDFNQRFTVYATDAHSVYYLLTPPVMEYLKHLCSMNQKLSISFDGTFLYILRTGRGGIFEPPAGRALNISDEVNKSYRELQEIAYCIEALRLDGRKEREEVLKGEGRNVQRKEQMKNKREEELYKELKEIGTGYEAEVSQVLGDDEFEGIGWSKY